ncbi:Sugar transferase [Candidatus Methylobacter favarea]|uniref:Sugar transferase n=1 Tax=Candidatus Methylobacter favarea TaxID=2707345 RepID=A0A8S0X6M7_9GAMM|nr:TIGR03088 family PEP-CTERM/XrtA system glycosyltransferase [Candidatus Methylobacter favarea]CAA9889365.1 Sugar transferase [Candidatus Methylobacter favarea]
MNNSPLIVHIIYRLGIGGLENGLVNLIDNMPTDGYRHVIISLTDSSDFQDRLMRSDVRVYQLNKKQGQDWGSFLQLYKLLKQLRPDIVHTRNLGTIEYQIPAWLAGIKHRVHGEHGWDIFDPEGKNIKYQRVRRIVKPLIQQYIPLSKHLENYLTEKIQVSPEKITRICNGVDTSVFYPPQGNKTPLPGCSCSFPQEKVVIGTVGRMHGVKDQLTLVKAFIYACEQQPAIKAKLKLFIVGDGPLREKAINLLTEKQLMDNAWLPGERSDVAEIMRRLDLFILPSLAEGISNTILEAMATGLPVIATNVGGNPELVEDGKTGQLTKAGDPVAMAEKILDYVSHEQKRREHGQHAQQRVLQQFSLAAMVDQYKSVYDSLLKPE